MRNWLLGAVTLWIPLYTVYLVVFVLPQALLVATLGATIVLVVALLTIYIADAYRNRRIPDAHRSSWAAALVMGNVVAMPVYWWLYLRPAGQAAAPAAD